MGLPGPVCSNEGLDREHSAWAGDPESRRLGSLGNTCSHLWYYICVSTIDNRTYIIYVQLILLSYSLSCRHLCQAPLQNVFYYINKFNPVPKTFSYFWKGLALRILKVRIIDCPYKNCTHESYKNSSCRSDNLSHYQLKGLSEPQDLHILSLHKCSDDQHST